MTVVSVLAKNRQSLEGASLGSFSIPDEFSSFVLCDRFFPVEALHDFALMT
jgi:hypothetical protein